MIDNGKEAEMGRQQLPDQYRTDSVSVTMHSGGCGEMAWIGG